MRNVPCGAFDLYRQTRGQRQEMKYFKDLSPEEQLDLYLDTV